MFIVAEFDGSVDGCFILFLLLLRLPSLYFFVPSCKNLKKMIVVVETYFVIFRFDYILRDLHEESVTKYVDIRLACQASTLWKAEIKSLFIVLIHFKQEMYYFIIIVCFVFK